MSRARACLAGLLLLSATASSSATSDSVGEWLYLGKGVRLVSFAVDTDEPGAKGIFVPDHQTGFIVLDEESFSVSAASPFNTVLMEYERGVLKSTHAGDSTRKSETSMTYRSALAASLDECLSQGLGKTVEEILSQDARVSHPAVIEKTVLGSRERAEFGKSLSALKRVTWSRPDPKRPGLCIRTVCSFKMLLPS